MVMVVRMMLMKMLIEIPPPRSRYQVCVIISPKTGAEVPIGEHTLHTNVERRRDGKSSGSNVNNTFSVSKEEWAAARNVMVNNTRLPVGVSVGALNA
jgi:hypothetical protein